jgi:DNA repair exonuclease SbcCD ATPase subunit
MKALIPLLVALSSIVALAAPPASAPATTSAAETRFAARSIRIRSFGIGPEDSQIPQSQVVKTAAEMAPTLLGLSDSDDANMDWLQTNTVVGQNYVDYFVTIDLSTRGNKAKPAAKEMADAIVASLEKFVRSDYDRQRDEQLEPMNRDEVEATQRVAELQAKANELRSKMRTASGRADVSAKNVNESLTKLEEEKQKLELEVMGKKARREALEQQIAKQSVTIEQKVDKDPIVSELQKAADARDEQVKFVKQQVAQGLATPANMTEAVAAAADAHAKLLQRKREASNEAGGDAVEAFNRELLTLAVDQNELDARLKYIESRLPGLSEATDLASDLDRVDASLVTARDQLQSADGHLRQFRLRASKPPQVLVTGSLNRANGPPPGAGEVPARPGQPPQF